MCGFPTTTIRARALVTATLNLFGLAKKPNLFAASIAKNSCELLTCSKWVICWAELSISKQIKR